MTHSRPETRPTPVMIPAAGARPRPRGTPQPGGGQPLAQLSGQCPVLGRVLLEALAGRVGHAAQHRRVGIGEHRRLVTDDIGHVSRRSPYMAKYPVITLTHTNFCRLL